MKTFLLVFSLLHNFLDSLRTELEVSSNDTELNLCEYFSISERNAEHKFSFEIAQQNLWNIYLCKMRWSLCNLCTHVGGEGGRMTKCKWTITAKAPLLTVPWLCNTEVRTINGFMLIAIWNVNAWENAMQMLFDYHKYRNVQYF